ncbi:MAG: hypothetical protein JWM11_3641, partial [Planctomycetaceae bacterium]|nr:hypothetical protein [Planctomycetaceae bacterium]
YRPLVRLGPTNFIRGATVTLPYSPEFAPRSADQNGALLLKSLAQKTSGRQRVNLAEMLTDLPRTSTKWPLAPALLIAGILLLLLEIAGRRLSLWVKFVDAFASAPPKSDLFVAPRIPVAKGVSKSAAKRALAATMANQSKGAEPSPSKETTKEPPKMNPFEEAKLRAKRRQS